MNKPDERFLQPMTTFGPMRSAWEKKSEEKFKQKALRVKSLIPGVSDLYLSRACLKVELEDLDDFCLIVSELKQVFSDWKDSAILGQALRVHQHRKSQNP